MRRSSSWLAERGRGLLAAGACDWDNSIGDWGSPLDFTLLWLRVAILRSLILPHARPPPFSSLPPLLVQLSSNGFKTVMEIDALGTFNMSRWVLEIF